MTRSRRHNFREINSEINIVPLLDVLLVLLLIFMTTVPIITITQSVNVNLPDAAESQLISKNDNPQIIIEVSGIGQYSMVVEKDRMDYLLPEQVITEAKWRLSENPKAIFLIGGEKDVPYSEIIKALNLLRSAGVNSVGLMTQPI